MNRFIRVVSLRKYSKVLLRLARPSLEYYANYQFCSKPGLIQSTQQLDQLIEKRLQNLRNLQEVDLGHGPVIQKNIDALLEKIIRTRSVEELKQVIRFNYRYSDPHHISHFFQTISNLIKSSSNQAQTRYEILGSEEFGLLSNRTLKLARYFEPSDALEIFLVTHQLEISIDTLLAQAMLQMIRYSLNEFSIQDVYRMVKVLKQVDQENHLVQAISLAAPFVLQHRISYKEIDFFSPRALLQCLEMIAFFGTDNFPNVEVIEKCLYFTNKVVDKLSLENCLNLLSFIYKIKLKEEKCAKLVDRIISRCIERVSQSDRAQLDALPAKFYVNAIRKIRLNQRYYNQNLFDLIADQAIANRNKFTLDDLYSVLIQNWNVKYVNYNLLQYFARLIDEQDQSLLSHNKIDLNTLFRFFTLPSDYERIHSNFTNLAQQIHSSHLFKEATSRMKVNYFFFIKNCIILGAKIDEFLVKDWFSEYYQAAFDDFNSQSKRHYFLKLMTSIHQGVTLGKRLELNSQTTQIVTSLIDPHLHEYVQLLRNEQPHSPSVTLNYIRHLASKLVSNPFSQLDANYVTDSGLVIDLLLHTDPGFKEKFKLEDKVQLVGFVFLSPRNYCRSPSILDGDTRFQLEMIRDSGVHLVPIDRYQFDTLPDPEKELFLHRQISDTLQSSRFF